MPLSTGEKLGPYEIIAPLGAGGMGEVYRARDTRLNRDVALKILPEDLAKDPSRRARFEQEARAVAALNHPNIVAIYDVGDGYIVTELVDGEPLRCGKPGLRSVRKREGRWRSTARPPAFDSANRRSRMTSAKLCSSSCAGGERQGNNYALRGEDGSWREKCNSQDHKDGGWVQNEQDPGVQNEKFGPNGLHHLLHRSQHAGGPNFVLRNLRELRLRMVEEG